MSNPPGEASPREVRKVAVPTPASDMPSDRSLNPRDDLESSQDGVSQAAPIPDNGPDLGALEAVGLDLMSSVFAEQAATAQLPHLGGAKYPHGEQASADATPQPKAPAGANAEPESPIAPPMHTGPDVSYHTLDTENAWAQFNQLFIGTESERDDNLHPWYRCLGVVRGMGASAALVERYYVCLDHKSEHAAFYSHIDQPRTSYATRVHFFDSAIDPHNFDESTWQGAYLGYVVCRRGDLPLVGRAMLRPPSYVQVVAAVSEPVHLLGHTLTATGCPFMQQDVRYANCAQVAAWVICYTAFRLGIMERRVIADIVDPRGGAQALRPHSPRGLYAEQVEELLGLFGFRSIQQTTTGSPERIELPNLAAEDLPPALISAIASLLGSDVVEAESDDITGLVANRWIERAEETNNTAMVAEFDNAIDVAVRRHVESVLANIGADDLIRAATRALRAEQISHDDDRKAQSKTRDAKGDTDRIGEIEPPEHEELSPADLAVRAQRRSPELRALEALRGHLLSPYLHSRMPIYLGTRGHAMVLVGSAVAPDRAVRFFVHDDQLGPYLAANDLTDLALSDLKWQTGFDSLESEGACVGGGGEQSDTGPGSTSDGASRVESSGGWASVPIDMVLHPQFDENVDKGVDLIRRVETVIIPGPARALLPVWAATKEAMGWINVIIEYTDEHTVNEQARQLVETVHVNQSVLMGIDYKAERLRQVGQNHEDQRLFGSVDLAEWVVLVEGLNESGKVVWEAVFDASSSELAPRLQLFRYLGVVVLQSARFPEVAQARLSVRTLPPLPIAEKVGKVSHAVHHS